MTALLVSPRAPFMPGSILKLKEGAIKLMDLKPDGKTLTAQSLVLSSDGWGVNLVGYRQPYPCSAFTVIVHGSAPAEDELAAKLREVNETDNNVERILD